MQPKITLRPGYGIPKFNVGQRTQQGKIIGIEVLPHDSVLAENCGHGYRYIVMTSRYTVKRHIRLQKSSKKVIYRATTDIHKLRNTHKESFA